MDLGDVAREVRIQNPLSEPLEPLDLAGCRPLEVVVDSLGVDREAARGLHGVPVAVCYHPGQVHQTVSNVCVVRLF